MVERMEKFLLRAFLSYDELDVVYQKDIIGTVLFTKGGDSQFIPGLTHFQGFNQFIRKGFACHVKNFFGRIFFQYEVGDGMHQVCFSESHSPIYEERVVNFSR